MKYNFKIFYSTREPYWNDQHQNVADKELIVSNSTIEYIGLSYDNLMQVLKDEIDYPASELTVETIRKDFSNELGLTDEMCEKIRDYYNLRLKLANEIISDIKDVKGENVTEWHWTIPESARGYTCLVDDEEWKLTDHLNAYIEISAVKE